MDTDRDPVPDRDPSRQRLVLFWRILFWFCLAAGVLLAGFLLLELTSPDRELSALFFLPAALLLLIWAALTRYIRVQLRRLRHNE